MIPGLPKPNHQIIGHRGAAGLAPENTLASFKQAATLDLNWVEFDVRQCSSGEWLVFHDLTLNRTTNGRGKVSNTPYSVIKELDAGSWFDPHFKTERVPLLSEVLTCLQMLNIHPNIEIKKIENNKEAAVENFLNCLNTLWPKTLAPPLISSFDLDVLILIKKKQDTLPIGYLTEKYSKEKLTTAIKHQFNTFNCRYKGLNPKIIKTITKELPLLLYTLNNAKLINQFLAEGVSAVFSDMTQHRT